MKFFISLFTSIFCLLFFHSDLISQQQITVTGTVFEGETNKTIPFANVYFKGTTSGVETDLDGNFEITTSNFTDTLASSYLGYEEQFIVIDVNKPNQVVNFNLEEAGIFGEIIEVRGKKGRYDKDGPGPTLMRKVRDNIDKNRPLKKAFYEYDKYEKIQFDLNNITQKFKDRKAFKKFQFIFDYVDTSDINGKTFLPIYIRESASKVFYRKDPKSLKEFREGIKISGLEDFVSTEGFNTVTDALYRDIDIYEEQIKLFDKPFVSPVSGDLAVSLVYRFYPVDTFQYKGNEVIKVSFAPTDKGQPAFNGSLLIKNDDSYAIVKAEFGVPKNINLNFVNDLKFVQEFKYVPEEDVWILSEDIITVDFSPVKKAMGFFATRDVGYDNHLFDVEREDDKYGGLEKVVDANDVYERNEEFWDTARLDTLSAKEIGIYEMIDTLQDVPAFRRIANILGLVVTGFQTVGPFDIGNIGSFYSFNPVEGFRLKLGGQTNLKFNPKIRLEGYGAYGFKDEAFKYAGGLLYSFNKDFMRFPLHYVRFSHQHDTKFVGQQLNFVNEDFFLLSFKRGTNDRMLFLDKTKFEYFYENKSNLSFDFNFTHIRQDPIGSLNFKYFNEEIQDFDFFNQFNTSEFGLVVKFAPNQEFVQGRTKRTPIFNKYPIMSLRYKMGVDGLGGDFAYHNVSAHLIKRFFVGVFGVTRLEAEAGRIWADGVPYLFLHLPVANQTFTYQRGSFNMMNFMEFVNDKWALAMIEHRFDGFIFSKIPLVKKLKLRSLVTFKTIYGGLDNRNDPNENPDLVQFLEEEDGTQVTTTLDKEPYMEGSFGVYNIFKVFRIDLVKRLNYLDRPDVPKMFGVDGLGARVRLEVSF